MGQIQILKTNDQDDAVKTSALVSKYASSSGSVEVAFWESGPAELALDSHPTDETCVILEGEVIIGNDGKDFLFKAGDVFVVPKGTKTTWTIKNFVKKIYIAVP